MYDSRSFSVHVYVDFNVLPPSVHFASLREYTARSFDKFT